MLSGLWLLITQIHEEPVIQKTFTIADSFGLLKDKTILMLFLGIVFAVGIDVGLNITIPKFLMERCGIQLEKAGLGPVYILRHAPLALLPERLSWSGFQDVNFLYGLCWLLFLRLLSCCLLVIFWEFCPWYLSLD